MTEEDFLPTFPALHRALLVDSRAWSRSRMLRELKGVRYFEQLLDPRTVEQAIQLISSHEFDACFLGPTLDRAAALRVLSKAAADSYSKDCARICFVYENCTYIEELLSAGAHGVIEMPCSRPALRLGIVRAVLKANENSPWTSILLSIDPAALGEEYGKITIIGEPSKPARELELPVVKILKDTTSELSKLLAKLEGGRGAEARKSGLAPATVAAVKDFARKMVERHPALNAKKGFSDFFQSALVDWSTDMLTTSKKQAAENLRTKLLAYQEQE